MEVARLAVEAGGAAAMTHFRQDVDVEWKGDGSPVTKADTDAENAIVGMLQREFPEHAILAEESGDLEAVGGSIDDVGTRWIVDPLDGTGRFARGYRQWGPLVALEYHGEVVVGAMALPALGEVYCAAQKKGCWRNGERVRVSSLSDWSRANLSLGSLSRILRTPQGIGVVRLVDRAMYTHAGGDLFGGALVLGGHAEAWIEMGVKVWDIAPFKVMIEEAGGKFTDLEGNETIESGACVATNGVLHDEVLAALRAGMG